MDFEKIDVDNMIQKAFKTGDFSEMYKTANEVVAKGLGLTVEEFLKLKEEYPDEMLHIIGVAGANSVRLANLRMAQLRKEGKAQ